MKRVLLLFILTASTILNAQSLFEIVQKCKQESMLSKPQMIEDTLLEHKCGTMDLNYFAHHDAHISEDTKTLLLKARSRPLLQKSIISPSGYFRIHYDSTGMNAPSYDINELTLAADSSYNYEIKQLGYLPPPSDGNAGGDSRYDIYVVELGFYGVTNMESEVTSGSKRYTSFIMLDQDFAEVKTKGLPGAQVTIAHEFHHAIQAGAYKFDASADRFFYEMTSTSMEEFVFDSVNDYYYYLPSYFRNPNRTFREMTGYEMAHWNIHLASVLPLSVIKRQWELFVSNDALTSIYISLSEANYPFSKALKEFGIKNLFTASKVNSQYSYEEGKNYPQLTPTIKSSFTPSEKKFTSAVAPTGYAVIAIENSATKDSLIVILSNSDVASAINGSATSDIAFTLQNYKNQGSVLLNNYYFATVLVQRPEQWQIAGEINGEVFNAEMTTQGSSSPSVYPSPYMSTENNELPITFSFSLKESGSVELLVVSISGTQVYNGSFTFDTTGEKEIRWKPQSGGGENLGSGVYFYVLSLPGSTIKGKFAVVR